MLPSVDGAHGEQSHVATPSTKVSPRVRPSVDRLDVALLGQIGAAGQVLDLRL